MSQSDQTDFKHASLVRWATYAAVSVALLLVVIKFGAWVTTGSVSILSTLIDSILDVLASLVNLLAVRHALQPADKEHRFGHGKAEPLAGLAQAAFVSGSAAFLLLEVGSHLLTPREIDHGAIGIVVMVVSIVITFALVLFQQYVSRVSGSVAISADSLHYKGDVLVNGGVILAIVLSTNLGWAYADPLIAGVVAIYILVNAYQIARHSLNFLMDRELPDGDRENILALTKAVDGVLGVHDLRTRSAGLQVFIQMHVEMAPEITLAQAHEIAESVMGVLMAAYPKAEVIIHEDPEGIEEYRASFS